MILTPEIVKFLKGRYNIDDVGVLTWELYSTDQQTPGNSQQLYDAVVTMLAEGSILPDRMAAEAGQPRTAPDWFYNACDLLIKRGQTYKTVKAYLKKEVAKVAKIAEENQRKADEEG